MYAFPHYHMGVLCITFQFQPGAVEGTVEVTPLSQAAGKGLDDMVTLLLNNGANINYLCSVSFNTSSLCM